MYNKLFIPLQHSADWYTFTLSFTFMQNFNMFYFKIIFT